MFTRIWKDVKYLIGCRFRKMGNMEKDNERCEFPHCTVVPTQKKKNIESKNCFTYNNNNNNNNLWFTTPMVATPVNYTSASDWQITVRRDNVISISQICLSTF